MSDNPYDRILPPSPLDKAVDKAIEERNAAYLADPEAMRRDQADAIRWRNIMEAERIVGSQAVVLPIATAQALLAALRGEPNTLDAFHPGLTQEMLADQIEKAARR